MGINPLPAGCLNEYQHGMSLRSREPVATPFLKWAGGKTQLLPQLRPLMPRSLEGRGYVEPFMGAGSVFFDVVRTLRPARCTLLDANPNLVNLFVQIRDHLDAVLPILSEHEGRHNAPGITVDERKGYYYAVRGAPPPGGTPEAAARFVYLNKTCFNGLHRENSKGGFNVPMGSYARPTILDRGLLAAASEVLQGVTIETSSFQDCERYIRDGDFVYLDPPYEPLSTTSSFNAYARDGFSAADQTALRDLLERISPRVQWMLSNSTADLIEALYERPGMYKHHVLASRSINSVSAGRGKIRELAVTNYPTTG